MLAVRNLPVIAVVIAILGLAVGRSSAQSPPVPWPWPWEVTTQQTTVARCPMHLLSVCGLYNFSTVKTYANACLAQRAGAIVLHSGVCYGDKRCPRNTLFQVCAKNPTTGLQKTYDNLCWAEKNWAIFVHNGPCTP